MTYRRRARDPECASRSLELEVARKIRRSEL
jgi:hypothetical protein